MSEYAQNELYKALVEMTAAKQVAAHAVRCLTTSADIGEALSHKALQCESILAEDLPTENHGHCLIDFANAVRQVVDACSQITSIEQEGCISGSYETVLLPSYGYAYNRAASSMDTFTEALNYVHCHLAVSRILSTLRP